MFLFAYKPLAKGFWPLAKDFALLGNHLQVGFMVINRPGVAGAVLQSPPSLIDSLIH